MSFSERVATFYRRLVMPSGFNPLDNKLPSGPFGLKKIGLSPLNGHIPEAVRKPRDHIVTIYDGRHFESNDYNTTMTWLQMARLDLVQDGIPCSRIARLGPAGTLGFTASCDRDDLVSLRAVLHRRNLFDYGTDVQRLQPPHTPSVHTPGE